ncbi:helix-turn-helix transcriptional regulator [Methylorubrum populi]|uniref:Helix-turn-helix transcriptional regulator n=1 Tax=Methylobacterium radiotolerans TaxID=31998 RepID=A0ABU7T933_9HYPH|nr:response regulator transcription factor [Methylobacterium sp. B4]PXW62174.1 DNA-binding NarL/FixJ family response regulator [Methylobacterium sp. B4]
MNTVDVVRVGTPAGRHIAFESQVDQDGFLSQAASTADTIAVKAATSGHTIILIDHRPLVGQCLLTSLRGTDKLSTFALYPSLQHWRADAVHAAPSLVVLCLPGGQTADAELAFVTRDLAELRGCNDAVSVIVMSDTESAEVIVKIFQLGVQGYIPTTSSLDVAVQAFRLVCAGGVYMPAACMLTALANGSTKPQGTKKDDEVFSPRQISVARALRKGTPNKIIAYELNMCESTVKVHVRNIMKKLKAKNRTEVAYLTNKYFQDE